MKIVLFWLWFCVLLPLSSRKRKSTKTRHDCPPEFRALPKRNLPTYEELVERWRRETNPTRKRRLRDQIQFLDEQIES